MVSYVFQWDFANSEGTWKQGDVVAFDPEFAEWLNRCSPGVLVPFVEERKQEPAQNRMVTKANNRKAGA